MPIDNKTFADISEKISQKFNNLAFVGYGTSINDPEDHWILVPEDVLGDAERAALKQDIEKSFPDLRFEIFKPS